MKTNLKNLLLSIGALSFIVPTSIALISCGQTNNNDDKPVLPDPDGGGDDGDKPNPPAPEKPFINWSEDIKFKEGDTGEVPYENFPDFANFNTGKMVDGIWVPVLYNMKMNVTELQLKWLNNGKDILEPLFDTPFSFNIGIWFDENNQLYFYGGGIDQDEDEDGKTIFHDTSLPYIKYVINGWSIGFISTRGDGITFQDNEYGYHKTLDNYIEFEMRTSMNDYASFSWPISVSVKNYPKDWNVPKAPINSNNFQLIATPNKASLSFTISKDK